MLPFPETSQEILMTLLKTYHDRIHEMRAGRDIGNGPYYLGKANGAEAQKFMGLSDRRYPVMLLPDEGTRVTVWLTGDPAYVHEELASLFHQKLNHFTVDNGHVAPEILLQLQHILVNSVACVGSPRVTVTARSNGRVKARRFNHGDTIKEPDAMFHAGPKIPKAHMRNFCAVEVAFGNEDVAGLIFEGHLWSQRSVAVAGVAATDCRAVNFVGLHVGRKPEDLQDASAKFAFGLLLCPSADAHHLDSRVYLFNASESYTDHWRQDMEEGPIGEVQVNHVDEMNLKYTYFCPLLNQIPAFEDLQFKISLDDLLRCAEDAETLEDGNHQEAYQAQTGPLNMRTIFDF
ncbi:unnamed protein product [Sympodiomycopsis kandeliae]